MEQVDALKLVIVIAVLRCVLLHAILDALTETLIGVPLTIKL